MGTETQEVAHGSCPCGKGTIRIYSKTPDHAWASGQSISWHGVLSCKACEKTYQLSHQEDVHPARVKLVRIVDVQARQKREGEYDDAKKALMASSAVIELLQKLTDLLKQQPSKAAIHRIASKLDPGSYSNFLRSWKSPENWVKQNVHRVNLLKVAELVGDGPKHLAAKVAHLEKLWAARQKPVPAVRTGIDYMAQQ